MRLLFAAFIAAFLWASSAPAGIPGDGRPVAIMACKTLKAAEDFVERLQRSAPWLGEECIAYHPPVFPSPELLAEATLVIGPLKDWEGDTFAVYEAKSSTGAVVYPFVWWGPNFSPIGWSL